MNSAFKLRSLDILRARRERVKVPLKAPFSIVLVASALSVAGLACGLHSSQSAVARTQRASTVVDTRTPAQRIRSIAGVPEEWCGPDKLSGQYECVTSAPLSPEEVRINMAYLAALKRLARPMPASSEIVALDSLRR